MKQEENVPEIENETRRLAVVNMDWNQVKVSLFETFLHFFHLNNRELFI